MEGKEKERGWRIATEKEEGREATEKGKSDLEGRGKGNMGTGKRKSEVEAEG